MTEAFKILKSESKRDMTEAFKILKSESKRDMTEAFKILKSESGMGSRDWHVSMFTIHLQRPLSLYMLSWTSGSQGK